MLEPPAATLRLFDGYAPADLARPEHRAFLFERLLEEGDREDLRWLAAQADEEALRVFFRQAGGRRLSARSRAFWALVLGESVPAHPGGVGSELWPLA